MAARVNEVETAMYSSVNNVTSVQAGLVLEIFIILSIDVLHYRLVAGHKHIHTYTDRTDTKRYHDGTIAAALW